MANSEGFLEQDGNGGLSEASPPVLRPPPSHLRLVSVCEPMSTKARDDDAPCAGPPAREQPRLLRQTKSQGLLDRSVQAQIGRMLRDVFSDLAEEPVPDRFVRLLEALEAQE
jgi:Anti-sigma factor NepR